MISPSLKILLADDNASAAALLEAVAHHLGHEVVIACNGKEAVHLYIKTSPDLVFMDIVMPEMDGLAACREIRALPTDRWVPVVFLSAIHRMDVVIKGLECGGDDYLMKPIDLGLLRAKINNYAKVIALQRQIHAYAQELERYKLQQQEENELARHVLERLTRSMAQPEPLLQTYNRPADHFSGDLLLNARTPAGVLHVLLADATGHGLAAALSAMPVPQIFYGMTAKGFGLAAIAAELNRRLKQIMPADRFIAATLVAIDIRASSIEVWNGGNPDVLYADATGGLQRWPSRHLPLGILPPDAFSDATETVWVKPGGSLFLCSDGLLDMEGCGPVVQIVTTILTESPVSARFHRLQDRLDSLLAEGARVQDDITFALLRVPREQRHRVRVTTTSPTSTPSYGSVSDWSFTLSCGADMLREVDVVPLVMGLLSQIEPLQAHQGALFLILSELYNNALDHGLLRLESTLKETNDGFARYLEARKQRLEGLQTGKIELGFQMHTQDGQPVLDIEVRDSGPGFDYADYLSPHANVRPHGRGIALVRGLCQELVYSGRGNEARARYAL